VTRIVPDSACLIPPEAERVFKGEIFDVYQWPQTLFDDSVATFERLKRPDTVVFIAVKDDKLVLINDEQPGRPACIRLPGGRVDAGEQWLAAVQRECLEEIGMRFGQWRLINVVQPVTKIEWFVALYIATDFVSQQAPTLDAGERISSMELSFHEAKKLVTNPQDPMNEYVRSIFEQVNSLEELIELPTFAGQEIN
jgi:ADP-ribose pyrophosphatase